MALGKVPLLILQTYEPRLQGHKQLAQDRQGVSGRDWAFDLLLP